MHDYFDIVGVPSGAPAREIRRACARRVRRWHPDFSAGICGEREAARPGVSSRSARESQAADVAIDFVDMSQLVDRIQAAFFDDRG